MKAEVLLDIPDKIAGKLATGALERVGGVIRESDTGKVVMWLRETSPSPIDSRSLPINGSNQLLGMAGHAASILNLGATVSFGTATLMKLSKIEGKLDIMDAKLDELRQRAQKLQWTVELGFANTLSALASIRQHQEIELAGDLNSAATLAWSCQFLEPGSQQRVNRIENALHTASSVKEKLLLHARQEMQAACEEIQKKRKSYHGFAFEDSVIRAIVRLRQAITASSLCASICAEADNLYAASSILAKEHHLFSTLLIDATKASLNSDQAVYATLLAPAFSEFMPALRVDSWARKYDGKAHGLFDVLDSSRLNSASTKTSDTFIGLSHLFITGTAAASSKNSTNARLLWPIEEQQERETTDLASTLTFINLIDGVDEDLDRLLGYQAEYKAGSDRNLGIHEYREALRLDDIKEANSLCFLLLKEAA